MHTTWILMILLVTGLTVGITGGLRLIRDGRRISSLVLLLIGAGVATLAAGVLLFQRGHPQLLIVGAIATLVGVILGSLVGYPLLVLFLLWSGITVLRRESRTLGNALALVAGIGLVLLPSTLGFLAPDDVIRDDPAYIARYALHSAALMIVVYFACAFGAFMVASLLYRWRRHRTAPEAIIVLGAGLINGEVPPLLAGRLRRAEVAHAAHDGTPLIVTSGGQGSDEPIPEGVAMRQYLIDRGMAPGMVIAETESANTEENLRFSRQILPDPQAPVEVVTSSYHVFRAAMLTRALGMRAHVLGARTAWYFVPSAVLREFVGVLRDHWKLHAIALVLLVALSIVGAIVLVPAMMPPVD